MTNEFVSIACLNCNVTTRGKKITLLLEGIGQSPAWLARQLGVSKQTVYNWLEGTKPQDESVWSRIADILKVPLGALESDAWPIPEQNPAAFAYANLQLWGEVPSDSWFDQAEKEGVQLVEVPSFLAHATESEAERIVVRVRKAVFGHHIKVGDLLVVELTDSPRAGRIHVVEGNSSGTLAKPKDIGSERVGWELGPSDETDVLSSHSDPEGNPIGREFRALGYLVAIIRGYVKGFRGDIEWDNGGLVL